MDNRRLMYNRPLAVVQKLLGNNAKSTPTGRVFLFTSLLVCEECRHKLVGAFTKGYYYYRCNQYFQRGRCSHNKFIREDVVEKWLFDHLGEELEKYEITERQRVRFSSRSRPS